MEKLPDSNDFELIKQLLNDEIDNEDILFTLIDQENLPQLVLRKSLINDCGFNYIRGLLNLIQRLLNIHDEVIDQWIGTIDNDNLNGTISIISFLFEILDHYYDQLCLPSIIDIDDL